MRRVAANSELILRRLVMEGCSSVVALTQDSRDKLQFFAVNLCQQVPVELRFANESCEGVFGFGFVGYVVRQGVQSLSVGVPTSRAGLRPSCCGLRRGCFPKRESGLGFDTVLAVINSLHWL